MRAQPGALTDKQIELLQTFADQAVIAIENARCSTRRRRRSSGRRRPAEILRVISRSPTDVQPVFDAIVAKRRFRRGSARFLLAAERSLSASRAHQRRGRESRRLRSEIPLDRSSGPAACVLDSRTIHLPDMEPTAELSASGRSRLQCGYRTALAPLLREGRAIGAISVAAAEVAAFSDKQVALLTTFADQAVIAIENARLFTRPRRRSNSRPRAARSCASFQGRRAMSSRCSTPS